MGLDKKEATENSSEDTHSSEYQTMEPSQQLSPSSPSYEPPARSRSVSMSSEEESTDSQITGQINAKTNKLQSLSYSLNEDYHLQFKELKQAQSTLKKGRAELRKAEHEFMLRVNRQIKRELEWKADCSTARTRRVTWDKAMVVAEEAHAERKQVFDQQSAIFNRFLDGREIEQEKL